MNPEIVGLDVTVAIADGAGSLISHSKNEPAGGISGNDIGVDIAKQGDRCADAIPCLAVLGIRFASEYESDTSFTHEIAFVGRIDEHFAPVDAAILHRDRHDSLPHLFD